MKGYMEEQKIETYLKREVEKIGGVALKFVPTGWRGAPDRKVLLPGGMTIFVELKAPGEKLKKLQVYRRKQLRNLGFRVECIDSKEKVDQFIEEVER